jgi:hypothetical protein
VRGESSRVAYYPAHRWYYFSDMQTDEVLTVHPGARQRQSAQEIIALARGKY